MDPIAVDIRLIRAVLAPELKIVPGRALMARVVAVDPRGRGTISIAGIPIDAQLPREVRAGDELRLVVRHASAERVVLGLSDQAVVPPPIAVPLPGGSTVRVSDQDEPGRARPAARDSDTLTLRYDGPALGAVDLRFELDPRSLKVTVSLPAGRSFELAQDAAGQLRSRLAESLGRAVSVDVAPRREPLDLYA
jgi:hypothetical protein